MSYRKNRTKDIFKTIDIILAIIVTTLIIMCIKYTPAYKVTLSGEIIGFVTDKDALERKIINYINDNSETIAHKQFNNLPEYEFELIPRNIKIDDEEVFEAIENTAIITYKADNIKLNIEQQITQPEEVTVPTETETEVKAEAKTESTATVAKAVTVSNKTNVDTSNNVQPQEPMTTQEAPVTVTTSSVAQEQPSSTPETTNTNVWKLEIPKINLSATIAEGYSKDILNQYIGHFPETVADNGNVGLAAHNRGYRVNYFNGIKHLEANDMLYYTYNGVTKAYAVVSKDIIYIKDWSKLQPTSDERLTLITCVENEPQLRLCVQAVRVY